MLNLRTIPCHTDGNGGPLGRRRQGGGPNVNPRFHLIRHDRVRPMRRTVRVHDESWPLPPAVGAAPSRSRFGRVETLWSALFWRLRRLELFEVRLKGVQDHPTDGDPFYDLEALEPDVKIHGKFHLDLTQLV